jgi:hypothetical protein
MEKKVLPFETKAQDEEAQATDGGTSPLDPAKFVLDQSFMDGPSVKEILLTVPVRKPSRHDFVRVNPDPAYRMGPVAVIEFRDEGELYLVDPAIARSLQGEFAAAMIYTAINRQGIVFLWPVKVPKEDGPGNTWHTSAMAAAEAE